MSFVVERLKRESNEEVITFFRGIEDLILDYEWYLKNGKEVAFIEIIANGNIRRTSLDLPVLKDGAGVYGLLCKEAYQLREYLRSLGLLGEHVSFDIKMHYMMNECNEELYSRVIG